MDSHVLIKPLESCNNKVALLARPNVRDAILNAPDSVQQVFVDEGFGWNTQNSRVYAPSKLHGRGSR